MGRRLAPARSRRHGIRDCPRDLPDGASKKVARIRLSDFSGLSGFSGAASLAPTDLQRGRIRLALYQGMALAVPPLSQ